MTTQIENTNKTTSKTPIEPASTKLGTGFDRLQKLGIEYRDEINGKPVYVVQSDSVISLDSHFRHKKLCDGPTFTTGHACVFSCEFCYVKSVLRRNKNVLAILKESGLAFEDIVIELADPAQVARKFLSGKSKPKFNDLNDQRVIYASPLVDIAATMDHVNVTVEVCLAILELTNWHIRLLSKSSLLQQVAKRIPAQYKHRMIYGLSTGTLDDAVAKIFEKGTALPSKRIEALHWLQDEGYRTFGMPCPTLPQHDYDKFAAEMAQTIRVDKCEHVWVEVLNPRGDSLPGTAKALRDAGRTWEADQLELVAKNKAAFEDYARKSFEAFAKVIPPEKLRFMQYVSANNYDWWKERENIGAILLGAHANKLTGPKKASADPLSNDEEKMWTHHRKSVRQNLKRFLDAYIDLGKFLAEIRDLRLYREDFKTFESYCRTELEIARSTAYGYISDYEVATKLSEISDISKLTREVHLRPMVTLPAPEREKAMELLKTKVAAEPLTPKLILEVVAEVLAQRPMAIAAEGSKLQGNGEAGVIEVATSEAVVESPPSPAPEPSGTDTTDGNQSDTTVATGNEVNPAAPPANPMIAFIATMRGIVRKAGETCPDYKYLLAKELRDLAATLET